MTEIEKIKKRIDDMSIEEFDNVLYNCGVESIKPSIESSYVKCLKKNITDVEYRKTVFRYDIKAELFDRDVSEQENQEVA